MVEALTPSDHNSFSSEPPSPAGSINDAAAFGALHEQEGEKSMGVRSSFVHAALGVGECIPGAGHIASAINAIFYATEGHDAEAAISAAGALIPGADQAAGSTQVLRTAAHLGMGAFGVGLAEFDKHRSGVA